MTTIRIHDISDGVLAVHLRDLIGSFGPRALQAEWRVAPVASAEATFEAFGPGAAKLEALAAARATVAGPELAALARDVTQIVWGEFTATLAAADTNPWVAIRFIDSTFCEIVSDDAVVLGAVRARFRDVREI